MRYLTLITLAALLALPAAASASDADLTRLGVKATTATQAYLSCGTGRSLVCVRRATAFVKADTNAIDYLTREVNAGRVKYGTACYRANDAIGKLPQRRYPWELARRWLFSAPGVSKADVVDAQIAFLRLLLKVRAAC